MPRISNKLYQLLPVLASLLAILLSLPGVAIADELSSSGYIIKMGTVTVTSGTKTGNNLKLQDTVGQTIQGTFEGIGYKTRAGFGYLKSTEPFSFTTSTNAVDFGTVKLGNLTTRTFDLLINANGVYGYSVSVIADHPLSTKQNQAIPDTACDASDRCTVSHAAPWTSSLTYGFGYNLTGEDVDLNTFADASYFRPFPSNAAVQNPISIMTREGKGGKVAAKFTLQINVPPSQPSGTYQNTIQFIALPSF